VDSDELKRYLAAQARINELEGLIRDLLRDVACEWYVKQFRDDRPPAPGNTPGLTDIANKELERRAVAIFERLRRAVT